MTRLLIVLALMGVLLAGCSGASAPAADEGGDQPAAQRTSLWVVTEGVGEGGQAMPYENGKVVTVGDVNVEMFIAPYPPAREGSIDLLVTNRESGGPVEGGGLEITFDMDMPHGTIRAMALPADGGHYLVPYLLVMPGTWQVDVTISHADAVRALAFIFKID